jgi:hypothetical protein
MDNKHQQYYQQINNLVLEHLTPVLKGKLENQAHLIESAKSSLANYYDNMDQEEGKVEVLELLRKMKTLKESLAASVNNMSALSPAVDLDEDFSDYFTGLQRYVDSLPESILEDQSPDRFLPFPSDSLGINLGKRFKKIGLSISWLPQRIANWFRKKRGIAPKELRYWKHQVPLRGMIIYHFRDLLIEQLIEMIQAINRSIAASTYELYTVESGLDRKFASMLGESSQGEPSPATPPTDDKIDEVLYRINELSESIGVMTSNRLERLYGMFYLNYEMVGTIELSVGNFEQGGLANAHKQAKKTYTDTMTGWQNTLSVLSDRYSFDHELFHTRFSNLEQYIFVSQKLDTRISEKILNEIDKISVFLESRQQQLANASTIDDAFKKKLKEVRFETSRFLKQAIPECIQLIREQGIPGLIEGLETKTKAQIGQLSEKRSLVKNISYEHAVKSSEISNIAPRELITFEALPEYLSTIQSLKQQADEVIESTQQQLMEISNICDFNLETALAAIDDESQQDKAKSMSIEGVERAYSRLQDIIDGLKELVIKGDKVIHEGVDDFNQRIMAMNEIDQVFDTQVRIAKAKAVEKTKALRAQFVKRFKDFFPRLITNVKRRGLMLYKRYREASKRYGIADQAQVLSAEISGFLSDTEKTLKNLPFVYQRLFEVGPLDNLYFYEPRPMASLSLRKAFENWQSGHFGATSLIGESGSGVTTLIYFFLKELRSKPPVIQLGTANQIHTKAELFEVLKSGLEIDDLDDIDSLVNYFNQLETQHIVVLEDLEHLFLRKVNGFDCIKILLELINRTDKNIFWIITINEYSFQYLSRTLKIDEYFASNIQLKPLKPDQVTSIILKRHRVSGFSIVYRPHKLDRKNKRFQKMTPDEQQEYLQKEYFNTLNRIAQSNIMLALVYWLRSILEIQEDVIYIRSIKGIDFSFLTKLSEEKLFILHAMLLHDGISISDHASIFQQTLEESKFAIFPLFDDGIIEHKEGLFYINPLLFRQVVNLLKDKNILH